MTQRNLRGLELERYKDSLELTETQREVIVGTLLGDASMSLRLGKPHYSIKFEQGIKNAAYVHHLYSVFEPFVGSPPTLRYIDRGKTRQAIWFRTYRHDLLIFYWNLFYKTGVGGKTIKRVPRNLRKFLTPRALAYWFMDDGSKERYGYYLHTQGFERHETELICEVLKDNFNLTASVHKDKDSWRVYINSPSAKAFRELVSPYILPCFAYRL